MGSQKALQKIKKRAIRFTVFFALMGVLWLLLGAIMVIAEEVEMGIIFLAMAALMIVVMITQIRVIANPKRIRQIKKNPQILTMWDELYENVVYEDKDVIYSEDIIANNRFIPLIVYFNDIRNITETTYRSNMIQFSHTLNLVTKDKKTIVIGIYGKNKKKVEELIANIYAHCPNLGENKYTSGGNSKVE